MGRGYPKGLTKKDIPYEAQIIRVADEFDAISARRQYKTHVGVSETLEMLVKETHPPRSKNLTILLNQSNKGKINPVILSALFKVILDDIEYEIFCIHDYIDYLKEQIKRLENVDNYNSKMLKSKSEKSKQYYLEGMKLLLIDTETVENYASVLSEYKTALKNRYAIIDNLNLEIKKIKKTKKEII